MVQAGAPAPTSVAKGGEEKSRSLLELGSHLNGVYGAPFVRFLVVVYCGLKGLVYSLQGSAQLPLFQSLGVSANNYQLARVVSSTPWAAKGWLGVLSDCFPLGRYHKRGYLMLSAVLGIAGTCGLLALSQVKLSSAVSCWLAAVFFLMANVQFATFDLLSEGKYAELMRRREGGPEVLSLVWACINFGTLAGSVLVYFAVDSYGASPLIALGLPFMLLAAWMASQGSLPEEPAKNKRVLKAKMMSQPRLFLLAFWMAVGAFAVAAAAALGNDKVQLAVTLSVSCALTFFSFQALPRTLAMSNLYMFLTQAVYLDLSGPLGYYYTAGPMCVPDGPNFTFGYYLAVGSFVSAIGGGLGSVLFQGMSTWTFRKAFWLTTIVEVVASAFDLVIVNRWNLALGFSDAATYLFGDAACQQMAAMLCVLPASLLTSRLCPRGAEATVYAVLAGFSNFGQSVAGVLGAWLSSYMGIDSAGAAIPGAPCDFSALSSAIVISHVVLPLLVLPLTFWMIPDARMDDESAFDLAPPPPSFTSAATSPTSSPRSPHAWPAQAPASPHAWPGMAEGAYDELPDGPDSDQDFEVDIVMTGH